VILGVVKVTGSSLYPAYQDGDFVIVSKIPILLSGLKPGDVIVYLHPGQGKRIKIVDHLEDGGKSVFVVGLHPDSRDSRSFGAIPRELVVGKVFGHIRKK
jgi:signal peptidase I